MRILIVNVTSRRIGGAEDYLNSIIPALHERGDRLALAHEVDLPQDRERIFLPEGTPCWDLSKLGLRDTLAGMRAWSPDIVYAHGLLEVQFEAQFLKIAPAVYFAHNYYGTCISGLKTFKFPTIRPCNRRFGPACLLQYFPRQCGGANPLTMWRLFRRESRRLANLRGYEAIVTHSAHMREEYKRQGVPQERLQGYLYEIGPLGGAPSARPAIAERPSVSCSDSCQLLFVGRMELLKGGGTLLEALPAVVERLGRPLRLVLAGDGPKRRDWESKAAELQEKYRSLDFEFPGWLDKDQLTARYKQCDLLVVPSLWPEPFGRVGPEAGLHHLPVAAFAVGGVTDWLVDGLNGFLAPGDPPTATGLAEAIVKCLEDPALHAELRAGAAKVASRFTVENHMAALGNVFDRVSPH